MKKLILLIIISFLFSCDNSIDSYMLTAKIVGVISDRDSGSSLDSANVNIFWKELTGVEGNSIHYNIETINRTESNEQGFYELTATLMEGESYYLGVTRTGYQGIYNFSYNAPKVSYKTNQRIDIQLKKIN